MFAVTTEGGLCFCFPNVCQTPTPAGPVPIPYPNQSQPKMAQDGTFSEKVFFGGMNACHLDTKIPSSNGDEPGVNGGVVSGMNMGPTTFLVGSMIVAIEGPPAVRLTGVTGQNGDSPNMTGTVVAPSQTKVMIMR